MTDEQKIRIKSVEIWLKFLGDCNKGRTGDKPYIPTNDDLGGAVDLIEQYIQAGIIEEKNG